MIKPAKARIRAYVVYLFALRCLYSTWTRRRTPQRTRIPWRHLVHHVRQLQRERAREGHDGALGGRVVQQLTPYSSSQRQGSSLEAATKNTSPMAMASAASGAARLGHPVRPPALLDGLLFLTTVTAALLAWAASPVGPAWAHGRGLPTTPDVRSVRSS
jgi:hypothetical protein